jgi:anti-sigma-K factor RskA
MTEHENWADAAGAYVLGAMPDGERRRYEGHLADCAICREEVDELRPAAEALPVAAPPMLPSPELKARIMAEVEREAALLAQAGPEADRPPAPKPRRRRSRLSGWRLAPAAATVLAVGVLAGFVIAGLFGGGASTYQMNVDEARLQGASAEVRVEDDQVTLVADGLPEPDGAYQAWIVEPGSDTPRPSLVFLPTNGRAEIVVPGAKDAASVLVTRERKRGARTPSEAPVMSANLS